MFCFFFHMVESIVRKGENADQQHFLLFPQNFQKTSVQGFWLYWGFNATLTAKVISWRSVTQYVFPGFLTPVLTQLSFQSHLLLFSHASAEVRGENTPKRKFASTVSRTHKHWVTSPIHSPLSHPCGQLSFRVVKTRDCLEKG